MSVQVLELDPITVSAERTAVTYAADRISYNVGVMPGTGGASVTEALATIPELAADIDGDGGEIEVGYEGERNGTDDDRLVRLTEDPLAPADAETADRGHVERERSHSLYATLEREFGDVSVEAGLRAEHVALDFELPGGETFGRDYTNLFPSANASYRIGEDWWMRLSYSYSRRVDRPGVSVLNPVDLSTDPLVRRVGNLEIEPEFTHTVTMDATRSFSSGRLRLSPHYRASRNGWAEITTVDDEGVSTRTYANVASTESYGASLAWELRQRDGWRANLSVSARYETRDASNLDARYSDSYLRFSSRANVNARITESLSAQGNVSYSPPADLPQGRRDARYRADFGLRYRLLDDRASVRLALRDPFELRRSSSRLRDVDYVLVGRSDESSRRAQLSLSYALGGGGEVRDDGGRRRRGRR